MPPQDDPARQLVRHWLTRADEDLAVAQHLLSQRPEYPATIAFHSQQAAEKCLKAVLVRHQVEFPKTHDIEELLNLVASADACLADDLRGAAMLTPYAVEARYPAGSADVAQADAQAAVEMAAQARGKVMPVLDRYLRPRQDG
jgi:HEPN domain-containing protein